MKDKGKLLAIGLLGTGALALAALAQTSQFDDIDHDHDNRITLDEWHGGTADRGIFSDRDGNDDLRLDENEFDALGFDDDFDEWDTNGDDYLNDNEYYDGAFNYFDEDEDGHWDGDEWDDAGDRGFWDV